MLEESQITEPNSESVSVVQNNNELNIPKSSQAQGKLLLIII